MYELSSLFGAVAIAAMLAAAWVIGHITFENAWMLDALTVVQLAAAIAAIYFTAPARTPGRWGVGMWLGMATLCVAPCVWWYGAIEVISLALAGPLAAK
jgi:hypothetical protein